MVVLCLFWVRTISIANDFLNLMIYISLTWMKCNHNKETEKSYFFSFWFHVHCKWWQSDDWKKWRGNSLKNIFLEMKWLCWNFHFDLPILIFQLGRSKCSSWVIKLLKKNTGLNTDRLNKLDLKGIDVYRDWQQREAVPPYWSPQVLRPSPCHQLRSSWFYNHHSGYKVQYMSWFKSQRPQIQ
jgi:hypothetical protein